jgi:uncharacterized Zn-binding protein involved in type VI secretion
MMGGMLLGAAVGVALIAAAPVGAVVAVSMATCAAIGCVAGGGLAGGQLVRGFQKACGLPDLQTGILGPLASPNVRIGNLFAARVMDTAVACDGLMSCAHPSLPAAPIAEGAATVRINNRPAARVTSKLVCGAAIKDGSSTVQIGGPTIRVLDVNDPEAEAQDFLGKVVLASAVGLVLLNPATLVPILGFVALNEGVGDVADAIWGKDSGARDIAQGALGLGALGLAGARARGAAVREADLGRAAAERDALGQKMGRKSATYTGGSKDGKVVAGRSGNPTGCAEDDVARQLGNDAQFTNAYGWRRSPETGKLEWTEIPVCKRCQGSYGRDQFPPDVKADPGGPWEQK